MICKDCELEVPKLNRKGVCPSCAHRQANANWAGEQYVPIKDLKGTKGYNIAIARRLKLSNAKLPKTDKETTVVVVDKSDNTAKEKDIKTVLADVFPTEPVVKKEIEVIEKENEVDFKQKCYHIVLDDARKSFKEQRLDLNFFKDIDLKTFLGTFTELLYNKSIYEDSKKAQEIFNGLSVDYIHNLKDVDWDENSLKLAGGLEKALVELRAPNQNFIYNYSVLKELLDYLRNDRIFMKLLDDTKRKVENNEPKIYGARASELVASQDFATKRYTYQCEVPGYGLYGERGRSLFTTQISAISEENAKDKLNEFLARKFSTFAYNQKDIRIVKI